MSPDPRGDVLLYVHGAGRQVGAEELRASCDAALGNRYRPRSRIAWYSNVCHGSSTEPDRVIAEIAAQESLAETAAERLMAFVAAELGHGVAEPDLEAATRFAADVFAAAAELPLPRASVGWPNLPRAIALVLVRDVTLYLLGERARPMRQPLLDELARDPRPTAVVAHSLGSVIAYDVMAATGAEVPLLVTPGSPLGWSFVLDRLRDRVGGPHPFPPTLGAWANVRAAWDFKAEPTAGLRPRFGDGADRRLVDHLGVDNPWDPHDLPGYLRTRELRGELERMLGPG
jgi:hypothetical protein